MGKKNIIVLDRDGVINHDSAAFIKSPQEWLPIAGSIDAIARLSKQNVDIFIATNQSGIARGLFSLDTLDKIHEKMCQQIEQAGGKIKGIYFCPHGPNDNCSCRKPKAGLLQQIESGNSLSLQGQVMVGDSLRDLQCAQAMDCVPVLVKTGKGIKTLETIKQGHNAFSNLTVYEDLQSFSNAFLSSKQ